MEPLRCCCYSNLLLWCFVRCILLLPPSLLSLTSSLSLKVEHHIEFNPKSQYHTHKSASEQSQTKCGGIEQTCVSTAETFCLSDHICTARTTYCVPPNIYHRSCCKPQSLLYISPCFAALLHTNPLFSPSVLPHLIFSSLFSPY